MDEQVMTRRTDRWIDKWLGGQIAGKSLELHSVVFSPLPLP